MNLEKIKNYDCGNYYIGAGDIFAIYKEAEFNGNGWFDEILWAYHYGLIRGQNSERNKRRKKATASKAVAGV